MLRVHSGLPFLSGPAAPPGLHDLGCLGDHPGPSGPSLPRSQICATMLTA